jgi:tetratricopeptide (TPR) repeat protein
MFESLFILGIGNQILNLYRSRKKEKSKAIVEDISSSIAKLDIQLVDVIQRQTFDELRGEIYGLLINLRSYFNTPNEEYLMKTRHHSGIILGRLMSETNRVNVQNPKFSAGLFQLYVVCIGVYCFILRKHADTYVEKNLEKSSIQDEINDIIDQNIARYEKTCRILQFLTQKRFSQLEEKVEDKREWFKTIGQYYIFQYLFDNNPIEALRVKAVIKTESIETGKSPNGSGDSIKTKIIFIWPPSANKSHYWNSSLKKRDSHIEKIFNEDFKGFIDSKTLLHRYKEAFGKAEKGETSVSTVGEGESKTVDYGAFINEGVSNYIDNTDNDNSRGEDICKIVGGNSQSQTPEQIATAAKQSSNNHDTSHDLGSTGSIAPEKSFQNSSADIHDLLNEGKLLSKEGKFIEAIECFDRALDIDSSNVDALICKGAATSGLGKFSEAIECFDRALDIDSGNTGALVNKGVILTNLGKFSEAIEFFDRTLITDPGNKIALNWKEKCFVHLTKTNKV